MAVDHNNPQSRDEEILIATIDGTEYNKLPQSRMEELLLELKEVIEEGGGGGGTTDYENLSNQPQVNGETLIGDKSGADLGLVDAEEGKGLSTNDYDDTEKAAVAAATSAITAMKDGSELDSFGDVEVALLDKADVSDLGTAAAKDSTNAVTSGSTDLVESGAVKEAIDTAVSSAYHHAGTKTVAQLTHDLLIAANEGNVYNITDSGTTTSDFIEGIGKTIDEGSNVGICKVGDVYMFDLLSGFVDTTNFVQKSQTSGLLKNDGTVNDEIEGDVDTLTEDVDALESKIDDSTTYPYADVITIEDAVPSNLADCSVKIEPVQDLHGYDHPWVGGAGKNLIDWKVSSSASSLSVFLNPGTYTISWNGTISESGNWYIKGLDAHGDPYTSKEDLGLGSAWAHSNTSHYNYRSINDPWSFTVPQGCTGIEIYRQNTDGTIPAMLEAGATATSYEPYSNICPITGHTEASVQRVGKNLWTNVVYKNSTGINSSGNEYSVDAYNLYKLSVKENTNYVLSLTDTESLSSSQSYRIQFLDASDNVLGLESGVYGNIRPSKLFTTPSGTVQVKVSVRKLSTNIQLELGQTATPYVPYAGKTYTIALGDTIYGGTVRIDSNGNTVMDVDRAIAEYDGSEDEPWYVQSTSGYQITISDCADKSFAGTYCICSSFKKGTNAYEDGTCGISHKMFCIGDTGLSKWADVTVLKTWLASNPLQVVYELATPTTIQLTPQQIQLLQGQNTLTASTGDISVTVNGVSGSIGSVQEQVNELAEEVAPIPIIRKGAVNFTSLAVDNVFSSNIVFDTPMPNADYTVTATASGTTVALCNVGNRTINGFTVYVRNIGTAEIGGAVMWQVIG